jgi:1,4-alpha-glucan branching enzyme
MSHDPIHRRFHHNQLCFRQVYAFSENYVLPLSHDEVVHGKGALIGKMPGDEWQKFANLRLLFGYMFAQPGKKLMFMGGEFGQRGEWNHDANLDWHLLSDPYHCGLRRWYRDLNTLYRGQPALHQLDCSSSGFQWIDCNDGESSVISFLRLGESRADDLVVICNFTPLVRFNYKVGLPRGGFWEEILNSDAKLYGGSGQGNLGGATAAPISCHGRPYLLNITLPPLGVVMFRQKSESPKTQPGQ